MLLDYFKTEDLITVICTSDYIFNSSEKFEGVLFKKGRTYIADYSNVSYGLMAVLQIFKECPEKDVQVGMSIETFNDHFKTIT